MNYLKKKTSLYDKEQHIIFNHKEFIQSAEVTEQELKKEEQERNLQKARRKMSLAERQQIKLQMEDTKKKEIKDNIKLLID